MEKSSRASSPEATDKTQPLSWFTRQRIIALSIISTLFVLGTIGFAIAIWQGILHGGPHGTVIRIVTSHIDANSTLDKRMYTNPYQSGAASLRSSIEKFGTIKNVWGFSAEDILLGQAETDVKVYAGEPAEFTIDQARRSRASTQFVDILAGEEEMCVSWIEADAPKDWTEKYIWFGHVGYACGQPWAYGETAYPADWGRKTPSRCMWMGKKVRLDADGGHGGVRQLKINMPEYNIEWASQGLDSLCGNTIFSNDTTGPIEASVIERANLAALTSQYSNLTTTRRSLRPRSEGLANRLIITSREDHSARELCLSPTSHSSDLVSTHEEMFCDMHERLLHPLCGGSEDEGVGRCFDLKRRAMVDSRGNQRRAPRRSSYLNVVEWK